jgi:hypothetical protein
VEFLSTQRQGPHPMGAMINAEVSILLREVFG